MADSGWFGDGIAEAVAAHKTAFRQRIAQVVETDLGRADPALSDQILVLFEGATHAAIYRGAEAVTAARAAARTLVEGARS